MVNTATKKQNESHPRLTKFFAMVLFLPQASQLQTTGNGSHRGSPDRAKNRRAPPAPKEAEPRSEEPGDDGAWPASLRRYLQRAFDKCDKRQGSRQHAELEKALHRKVTDAMADNAMLTKDWDKEPLPRYGRDSCVVE